MSSGHSHPELSASADPVFRKSLRQCLVINFTLFLVELVSGVFARSLAVLADAMDFLSDSVSYGLGLFALNRPPRFRSYVALLNAASMAILGMWIMWQALLRLFTPEIPHAGIMGGVSLLALGANVLSARLLYKHREGDSLEQSLWMCSRNDIFNNAAMLLAAGLVLLTETPWPDMAIAVIILTVELRSAWLVSRQAIRELIHPE